jgi:hypothetical protein
VAGVIVIVIVSPPSLNTMELSMTGANPEKLPGRSFKEGRRKKGCGWNGLADESNFDVAYVYVTRAKMASLDATRLV